MSKLAALKAKFSADAKKLARAFGFLAEDPSQSVEQIETKLAAEETPAPAPAAAAADPEEATFAAIAKTFGTDKPRLARALAHFAADSTLTVEQIAAKLQAEDTAEQAAALATAQQQVADSQKQLAAEKARADAAEKKLSAVMASGRAAPVDLGVAAGQGAAASAAAAARPEPSGLNRVAAAFKADAKNPANAGRN